MTSIPFNFPQGNGIPQKAPNCGVNAGLGHSDGRQSSEQTSSNRQGASVSRCIRGLHREKKGSRQSPWSAMAQLASLSNAVIGAESKHALNTLDVSGQDAHSSGVGDGILISPNEGTSRGTPSAEISRRGGVRHDCTFSNESGGAFREDEKRLVRESLAALTPTPTEASA